MRTPRPFSSAGYLALVTHLSFLGERKPGWVPPSVWPRSGKHSCYIEVSRPRNASPVGMFGICLACCKLRFNPRHATRSLEFRQEGNLSAEPEVSRKHRWVCPQNSISSLPGFETQHSVRSLSTTKSNSCTDPGRSMERRWVWPANKFKVN